MNPHCCQCSIAVRVVFDPLVPAALAVDPIEAMNGGLGVPTDVLEADLVDEVGAENGCLRVPTDVDIVPLVGEVAAETSRRT